MGILRGLGTMVVVAVSAAGTLAASGVVGTDSVCGELQRVVVDVGEVLCTHGDDPGFAAAEGEVTRTGGAVPSAREQCHAGGVEGPRVQVLYLHAADATNRLGTLRADVLRWSRQVEWTVVESAKRHGGVRHVRWTTTRGSDGNCVIDVRAVSVAAVDLNDFGSMVSSLRRQGWDEPDRKYLLFADDDTYCGLGSAPRDDRAGMDNSSERRAGYARVDRPCWDSGDRGVGSTAAHELFHTLGAVQDTAPHASGRAHCTDEYDLLCYDDGAGVTLRCRDASSATSGAGDQHNALLDCGGDDYFHPSPRAGSYLDTHWNTARSSFLAAHGSDGPGSGGSRDAGEPVEEPSSSEQPLINRVVAKVLDELDSAPTATASDRDPTPTPTGAGDDRATPGETNTQTLGTPAPAAKRLDVDSSFSYLPWWDR